MTRPATATTPAAIAPEYWTGEAPPVAIAGVEVVALAVGLEALIRAEVELALAKEDELGVCEINHELLLDEGVEDGAGVDEGVAVVEGEARMTWTVVVEVGAGASACSAASATGAKRAADATRRALVKYILNSWDFL